MAGYMVVIYWLCISSSGEIRKFDLERQGQLPHKRIVIFDQGILHLWSKFGDPSLSGSRVNYDVDKLKME